MEKKKVDRCVKIARELNGFDNEQIDLMLKMLNQKQMTILKELLK